VDHASSARDKLGGGRLGVEHWHDEGAQAVDVGGVPQEPVLHRCL
jgi:hypothetical protein